MISDLEIDESFEEMFGLEQSPFSFLLDALSSVGKIHIIQLSHIFKRF